MNNSMNKGTEISIPKKYCCPISGEIMAEPVCTMDGQTYDRKYIEEWLFKNNKNTSPATNKVLSSKKIIPNWSLNSIISEYDEHNHQFQDEYSKQKDISKSWHVERKKYVSLGNSKAFGAIEYPALPQQLFNILYKKINETVNLLNYYRDLNQDYFISWLVKSYKLYTIETESFVQSIERKEELELFLENNQAFYYLAKDYDVQEIILLTTNKALKWLFAINGISTIASKFQRSIALRSSLKELDLPLKQVEHWEDKSRKFRLLAYLVVFSVRSNKLIKDGNFSLQNEEKLDALQQINLLKNEKGVGYFFEKIFSNFCESFLQLIAKDQASIPWYKWVDLWKEGQFNENKKEKIFEQILDIEKNGEHPKFSTFIKNIKANWFKNDSNLINDFHKHVSLKSLFFYYQSSSENEKRNILDETRSDTIYEYLNNRKITPSQALQWFFDPILKPKTSPLYVVKCYGEAPILSFKERLEEFKYYQEKKVIDSTETIKSTTYSTKHDLKITKNTKKVSMKEEGYKQPKHANYRSLYSRNNTTNKPIKTDFPALPNRQPNKKNNSLNAVTICIGMVYILGGLSGIGGETYHLLSKYDVVTTNKTLSISLMAAAFTLLLVSFITQLTQGNFAKTQGAKGKGFCNMHCLANAIFLGGILSTAGSAVSLYFDLDKIQLVLFISAASLIIISVVIKNYFPSETEPKESPHDSIGILM